MAASVDWYWTDLVCPWNYKRRKAIMHMTTKLVTILDGDFRKTNELIACFNEKMPGKTPFNTVSLNPERSLADNCKVLAKSLEELSGHLNNKRETLQNLMDPKLFSELMSSKTSFPNKIKTARTASKEAISAAGGVPGMVVVSLMSGEDYLQSLIDSVNGVSNCGFAWMKVGSLSDSPDEIIARMKNERASIDENISDLEANLEKFDHESHEFNRAVDRVIVRIDG